MVFLNVEFSVGSAWVVAVSMRVGFRCSDNLVHPEHRVRTLNLYQSETALYTWLNRKNIMNLGKRCSWQNKNVYGIRSVDMNKIYKG